MKKLMLYVCAALAFTACAGNKPAETVQPVKKEIGVQLYSVRSLIGAFGDNKSDIAPVLKMLAEQGYTQVEAASYSDGKLYGMDPAAYKKAVEDAGLVSLSSHVNRYLTPQELKSGKFDESMKWWDQCVAAHKAAGVKYIVMPSQPRDLDLKGLKTYCNYYNEVGKKCLENGIRFGYHNHSQEFVKVEDQVIYDFMLQNTDPQYVFFEMDVYWTVMGRAYPVEIFNKYPGRFRLLHIKDHFALGASGMVGFDAIFNAAKTAGLEGIIVEVEGTPQGVTIEQVMKESVDYLLEAPFVPESYAK